MPIPISGGDERPNGALDGFGLAEQAEAMPREDVRRVAASIAMFERLTEHWLLRATERERLLGGVPKSTWSEWRRRPEGARLKADTRERIANLFAIDLSLHALFAREFADRWIREPNSGIQGDSPLATMLQGNVEDVIMVRRYLERVRTSSPGDVGRTNALRDSEIVVSYLGGMPEHSDESTVLAEVRHIITSLETIASTEPMRYHSGVTVMLTELARWLGQDGAADGLSVLRRAVELQRQLLAANPEQSAYFLIDTLRSLERLLTRLGMVNEARPVTIEVEALCKSAVGEQDTA